VRQTNKRDGQEQGRRSRHDDDGAWKKQVTASFEEETQHCACPCRFNAPSLRAHDSSCWNNDGKVCHTGHSSPADPGGMPASVGVGSLSLVLSALLLFPLPRLPGPAADIAARPCIHCHRTRPWAKRMASPLVFSPLPSGLRLFAGLPSLAIRRLVVWSQPAPSSINHRPCSHPCRRLMPSTYPTHRIDGSRRASVRPSPRVGICGCKKGQLRTLRKEVGRYIIVSMYKTRPPLVDLASPISYLCSPYPLHTLAIPCLEYFAPTRRHGPFPLTSVISPGHA